MGNIATLSAPAAPARTAVPIGRHSTGSLDLDLDRLLAGRILLQGGSGAGKSRTMRRIVEEAFDYFQTMIVDPEGEFGNLAEHIGATTLKASEIAADGLTRLIGFDAGVRDTLRANHAAAIEDPLYDYDYPLRRWGWDRDACTRRIQAAGLPVPPKSSCWFCIGMTPDEIRELPAWCLRLIVRVEARAAPRLHTVEGLWRKTTRARPGRMTDFIRRERLLPAAEVDRIWRDAPADLIRFQDVAAMIPVDERPTMADWLELPRRPRRHH